MRSRLARRKIASQFCRGRLRDTLWRRINAHNSWWVRCYSLADRQRGNRTMKETIIVGFFAACSLWAQTAAQYPNYPSETPTKFQPSTSGFDYTRREAMIPMRDGVKLHTVILIPKGARNAPLLL